MLLLLVTSFPIPGVSALLILPIQEPFDAHAFLSELRVLLLPRPPTVIVLPLPLDGFASSFDTGTSKQVLFEVTPVDFSGSLRTFHLTLSSALTSCVCEESQPLFHGQRSHD